jgi:hypothetical protein
MPQYIFAFYHLYDIKKTTLTLHLYLERLEAPVDAYTPMGPYHHLNGEAN